MDNLTSVTDAYGNSWVYEYDAFGNITKISDSLGNETTYSYDQYGRIFKITDAAGNESHISYNDKGQVVSYTDFGGNTSTYTYDSKGREISLNDGEGTISCTYNSNGQIESVKDESGTIFYTYDSFGNLASVKDAQGNTIQYSYDACGNMIALSYSENTVSYEYDIEGRLTRVVDGDGNFTTYSYDKLGNLAKTEYSNGVVTTYEYNSMSVLIKLVTTNSQGTILASYEYTIGANGERLSCQELNRKVTYTYDDLGRLTSEIIESNGNTSVTTYAYDANSNRVSMTKDGVTTTYKYNELNQLVQAGNVVYTYDNAGNLVAQSANGILVASYEYNSRNQMVKAVVNSSNGTLTETYTYNVFGDRTSKTSNGVTTYYTIDYSGEYSQILAATTASESVFYIRGHELISTTTGDDTSFYLFDGGNTVRALTDMNGSISDEYIFDAFGNELAHSGSSDNEYGLQGELKDATGLYYLRARYMDPQTGTFTSMDTYAGEMKEPMSLNKYLFAFSNPIKYCDPSGHFCTLVESMMVQFIATTIATISIDLYKTLTGKRTRGSGEIVFDILKDSVVGGLTYTLAPGANSFIDAMFESVAFALMALAAVWAISKALMTVFDPDKYEQWSVQDMCNAALHYFSEFVNKLAVKTMLRFFFDGEKMNFWTTLIGAVYAERKR